MFELSTQKWKEIFRAIFWREKLWVFMWSRKDCRVSQFALSSLTFTFILIDSTKTADLARCEIVVCVNICATISTRACRRFAPKNTLRQPINTEPKFMRFSLCFFFSFTFYFLSTRICCMRIFATLHHSNKKITSAHGYSVYNAYASYNPVSRRDSELASLSSGRTDSDTMSISSMSTWVDFYLVFLLSIFFFTHISWFFYWLWNCARLLNEGFDGICFFFLLCFAAMDDLNDVITIIIIARWSERWFATI